MASDKLPTLNMRVVLGLVVMLAILNGVLLSLLSPPASAVFPIQYQSLAQSVSAAVHYDETGELLVIPWAPDDHRRIEDMSADDLGFPLLLSALTRTGLLNFSDETRAFVAQGWGRDDSRAFMYDTLRHDIDWLNRLAFSVTSSILTLVTLVWIHRRSRKTGRVDKSATSLAIGLFVVCQLLPHFDPQLVSLRLHQHGLIPTLVLLGLFATTGFWLALERIRWRPLHARSVLPAAAAALLCGALIGGVALIRRSEGVAWMVSIVVVFGFWVVANRALRSRQLAGALLLGALLVGWSAPAMAVDRIVEHRDTEVLEITGEKAISAHPIYHVLLIGISQSPKNALGIANEAEVVELVQRETGFIGTAFTPGYEAASSEVYWDYVRSSPVNYLRVLIDNIDLTFIAVVKRLGVTSSSWVVLAFAVLTFVVLVGRLARRIGGLIGIAFAIVLLHLGVSGAIAVMTTPPGTYGPATDLLLIAGVGLAGQIYRHLNNVTQFFGSIAESVRSLRGSLPAGFSARTEATSELDTRDPAPV